MFNPTFVKLALQLQDYMFIPSERNLYRYDGSSPAKISSAEMMFYFTLSSQIFTNAVTPDLFNPTAMKTMTIIRPNNIYNYGMLRLFMTHWRAEYNPNAAGVWDSGDGPTVQEDLACIIGSPTNDSHIELLGLAPYVGGIDVIGHNVMWTSATTNNRAGPGPGNELDFRALPRIARFGKSSIDEVVSLSNMNSAGVTYGAADGDLNMRFRGFEIDFTNQSARDWLDRVFDSLGMGPGFWTIQELKNV